MGLSYETDPDFWHLMLKLAPYISKDGEFSGNRISFDEFKILLWRYHGRKTLRECTQLLNKKISKERIRQIEVRALNIIKELLINGYTKY